MPTIIDAVKVNVKTYSSNNASGSDVIGDDYNSMAMKGLIKNGNNEFNENQVEKSGIILYLYFNFI